MTKDKRTKAELLAEIIRLKAEIAELKPAPQVHRGSPPHPNTMIGKAGYSNE